MQDHDLLRTINRQQNTSLSGLPLRPSMVFAGREAAEPSESRIDFASYLALTYFFHEDDCNAPDGHTAWKETVEDVASKHGVLTAHAHEPTLMALEVIAILSSLTCITLTDLILSSMSM